MGSSRLEVKNSRFAEFAVVDEVDICLVDLLLDNFISLDDFKDIIIGFLEDVFDND